MKDAEYAANVARDRVRVACDPAVNRVVGNGNRA
jgi:hypothetical protein